MIKTNIKRVFSVLSILPFIKKEDPSSYVFSKQKRRHADVIIYLKLINLKKSSSIIIIGCGNAEIIKRLKEDGHVNVDAVDWLHFYKIENKSFIDEYFQIDLNNSTLFKHIIKKCDCITSYDVLEYLENRSEIIKQNSKLAKATSGIMIIISYALNIYERLIFSFTGNSNRYRVEKKNEYDHITIFTRNTMKSICNRVEICAKKIVGSGILFFGLVFFPDKKFAHTFLSFNLISHLQKKLIYTRNFLMINSKEYQLANLL